MTNPPRPSTVTPRLGPVTRLKLREPVRLYLYSLGSIVVAGLVLAGWVTGDWADFLYSALATVLAVVPGAEAARASVYSVQSHAADLMRAHAAGRAAVRVDQAAGW